MHQALHELGGVAYGLYAVLIGVVLGRLGVVLGAFYDFTTWLDLVIL